MNDVATVLTPDSWANTGRRRVIRNQFAPIAIVMLMTAAVYVGTCAWPVILDETDGQYAGAAREMVARGDWLVPTNDGAPRLQKPPLVYWLTIASLKLFGINEFAARLPNALATVAWVFATYLIGKQIGGERRGVLAATILGSMMGLFLFTHRIMPEPFLATFISLAVWCFLNALLPANKSDAVMTARRWFFWAWVFMGLGVLTKGLHGALWPLLIAGGSAVFQPKTRSRWKGLASLGGFAAFLAITLPWYVLMAHRFPGFLGYHFFNEQAGHAFNMHTPRDCTQVPLVTFWAQHLLYWFPWVFLLPAVVATQWRSSKNSTGGETAVGERLLWIWIAITALTISFSARQDHYSMTCWGALAVCLALPLTQEQGACVRGPKWLTMPAVAMALAGVISIVAALGLSHPVLATATQVKPEAARDDIHSAIRGLSSAMWRDCGPLAIAAGAALLIGGVLAGSLASHRRAQTATFMLAGSMALIFPLAMRGYVQMQGYFSLADAAKAIRRQASADALIACEGEPHLSASLFFYLDRQVAWTGAQTGSVAAAESHGIPVAPFVSGQALARAWHSGRQVFLILEESNLPKWKSQLSVRQRDNPIVARDGTRLVISNRVSPQLLATSH